MAVHIAGAAKVDTAQSVADVEAGEVGVLEDVPASQAGDSVNPNGTADAAQAIENGEPGATVAAASAPE